MDEASAGILWSAADCSQELSSKLASFEREVMGQLQQVQDKCDEEIQMLQEVLKGVIKLLHGQRRDRVKPSLLGAGVERVGRTNQLQPFSSGLDMPRGLGLALGGTDKTTGKKKPEKSNRSSTLSSLPEPVQEQHSFRIAGGLQVVEQKPLSRSTSSGDFVPPKEWKGGMRRNSKVGFMPMLISNTDDVMDVPPSPPAPTGSTSPRRVPNSIQGVLASPLDWGSSVSATLSTGTAPNLTKGQAPNSGSNSPQSPRYQSDPIVTTQPLADQDFYNSDQSGRSPSESPANTASVLGASATSASAAVKRPDRTKERRPSKTESSYSGGRPRLGFGRSFSSVAATVLEAMAPTEEWEKSDGQDGVDDGDAGNAAKERAQQMALGLDAASGWSSENGKRSRSPAAQKIWRCVEDRTSSTISMWYSRIMMLVILGGAGLSLLQLLLPELRFGRAVTLAVQAILALELLVRFLTCPSRDRFISNPFNVFELLATMFVMPTTILAMTNNIDKHTATNLSVFFPALMMLRLLRRFKTFLLLISAFQVALEALPVLFYTLFLLILLFSATIYIAEPQDNIHSWSDALWLVLVTISTVGYGDLSPVTIQGKMATSALIGVGALYMAIPIGIVGTAFSKVWEDRERLLILQSMRDSVLWAGYQKDDVLRMFRKLDIDGDNQLTFEEFREMMKMMHIHATPDIMYQVFQTFDEDGEGSIDFSEFLKGVFPSSFVMSRSSIQGAKRSGTGLQLGDRA